MVVEVAGKKVLINERTGETIKELGSVTSSLGTDKKEQEAQELAYDTAVGIKENITRIRDNMNDGTTGMYGGSMAVVFGTDAHDQDGRITELQSKLGLDKLKELRDAAKSGASGMGNLTEKELEKLESALGNISISQSAKKQKESLGIIERHYAKALIAYNNIKGTAGTAPGGARLRYNSTTGQLE